MNVPDESGINEEITNQPRPQDYSIGYQVIEGKQSCKYKNTEKDTMLFFGVYITSIIRNLR